ncbi:MAG TPA: flagellar basal body protein [Bryobacteraceae bacterium]|nr:flagellar basal body protein [Bryobacteraceae bacterium]
MIDGLTTSLERYMDLLSARQKVVSSNIANVDTPGYKTKDLNFQAELQAASYLDNPLPVEVPDLPVKNDGNNVSLDREARLLAENDLRFTLASVLVRGNLSLIKSAIHEGKTSA